MQKRPGCKYQILTQVDANKASEGGQLRKGSIESMFLYLSETVSNLSTMQTSVKLRLTKSENVALSGTTRTVKRLRMVAEELGTKPEPAIAS